MWARRLERFAVLVAVGLVVILGRQNGILREGATRVLQSSLSGYVGMYVPSFSATTLQGDDVSVGSPGLGESQIIYFFLTSCEFCQASTPMVRELAEQVAEGAERISFVAVSVDSLPPSLSVLDSQGIPDPVVHLSSRRLASLFKAGSVPRLLVVDHEGRVAYVRTGMVGDRSAVDSVLAAADTVARVTASEEEG